MRKDYFEEIARKISEMGLKMEGDLGSIEEFLNMENIEVYFYVNNKNSLHLYSYSLPCAQTKCSISINIFNSKFR